MIGPGSDKDDGHFQHHQNENRFDYHQNDNCHQKDKPFDCYQKGSNYIVIDLRVKNHVMVSPSPFLQLPI